MGEEADVSRQFGPANLKVQTIWKNITKIINETEKKASRIKRIIKSERNDVKAMLKWFKQASNDTVPVISLLLIIAVLPTPLFLLLLAQQPPVGQGLLIFEVSRSHTTTQHSR